MIRLAAVGGASTGKSSLLNVVFGASFIVDPRAGSTRSVERAIVSDLEVIDSPPWELPDADAYVLVCDKDLTAPEYELAQRITRARRSLLVALNKSDTYTGPQMRQLLAHIRRRVGHLEPAPRVVACAADPVRIVHRIAADGTVEDRHIPADPLMDDVLESLRELIRAASGQLRVRVRESAIRIAERLRRQ